MSHVLTPPPPNHELSHFLRPPPSLEHNVLHGRPLNGYIRIQMLLMLTSEYEYESKSLLPRARLNFIHIFLQMKFIIISIRIFHRYIKYYNKLYQISYYILYQKLKILYTLPCTYYIKYFTKYYNNYSKYYTNCCYTIYYVKYYTKYDTKYNHSILIIKNIL